MINPLTGEAMPIIVDDVLVNLSALADAWELDTYWSRTTKDGVTTDKGWVISP